MRLLKRFGYYLIGVAIGSLGVAYFWKQKDVSFDYGMDARTLKTIRIKKRLFSDEAKAVMESNQIDTTMISTLLKNADVDFGKSKPRQKPCAEYYITGKGNLEKIHIYVIRCDSTATIDKIFVN